MSSKLVLVLNCGSSSLKFAIIDATNGEEHISGLAECFHLPEARIKWKVDGGKQEAALGAGAAHSEALNLLLILFWHKTSAFCSVDGHRSPYRSRRREIHFVSYRYRRCYSGYQRFYPVCTTTQPCPLDRYC